MPASIEGHTIKGNGERWPRLQRGALFRYNPLGHKPQRPAIEWVCKMAKASYNRHSNTKYNFTERAFTAVFGCT
jgi:hypothetical protein